MSKLHISPGIAADLGKLNADQRREILRIASSDTENISARGENRPVAAVDMPRKVLPSARVSSPGLNREPPPTEMKETGKA
jgi:hypothetical protein